MVNSRQSPEAKTGSDSFSPPLILRNPHLQTILASLRPKTLLGNRVARLRSLSRSYILNCSNNVHLLGSHTSGKGITKGLVILLHGWEGGIDSSYLLSAATLLVENGFDVFRLNLRDHGASHHLNHDLFHSARLEEVVNGTLEILKLFPNRRNFLAGFSLGGNFALRIGIEAVNKQINIERIVAISPLISPLKATLNLEENLKIYHNYFVRKWRRSLKKKLTLFPDLNYGDELLKHNSLSRMNDYFVPHHTGFGTAEEYLNGYGLTAERLAGLSITSHIISSADDPITELKELLSVSPLPPTLHLEITRYGGHCGFLYNRKLQSWADQRLVAIFSDPAR